MIESREFWRKAHGLLLVSGLVIGLQACGGRGTDLQYGQLVPAFRINVTFEESLDPVEAVKRLAEPFAREGIVLGDEPYFLSGTRATSWTIKENERGLLRRIRLIYPYDTTDYKSFDLQFSFKSMEDIDIRGWKLFALWYNDYLPAAYPDAELKVVHHPARFTPYDKLEQYATESGVELTEQAIQQSIKMNGGPSSQ